MTSIQKITKQRSHIRSNITKLADALQTDSLPQGFDSHVKQVEVQTWETKLNELNEQYQSLVWDETNESLFETDLIACDAYTAKLAQIFLALRARVTAAQPPITRPTATGGQGPRSMQLKRPQAPIPKLPADVGGSRIVKYFKEFEAVVNRYEFDTTEKFWLLKENIRGKPLTIVENMEYSDPDYEKAKKLITDALANPITIKFEIIDRLLSINSKKFPDSHIYVSEFSLICDEITSQNINIQSILQYCLLKGMDSALKDSLIQVSNKSFPTFEDYNKFIYEAIERTNLNAIGPHKGKSTHKTEALAITVPPNPNPPNLNKGKQKGKNNKNPKENKNKKQQKCTLCEKGNFAHDHATARCQKFISPEAKLDFIRKNGGCVSCSYFSHTHETCRFPFRNICHRCGSRHFEFLCVKSVESQGSQNKLENQKAPNTENTANIMNIQASSTWAFTAASPTSTSILKTFTADSENGNRIRFLKDEGSELSFFCEGPH